MNKLVSKNPVLRFKEGRKIVKMLYGTPGKSSNEKFANWLSSIGPKIFSVKPTGSGLLGWINGTSSNLLNNSPVELKLGQSSTTKSATIGSSPLSSKLKIVKRSGKDKNGNPVIWNEDENGNFISGQYVSDDGNTYWKGSDGSITLIKRGNSKVVNNSKDTRSTGTSYRFGKIGGWDRSIGEGTINDPESLNMLKEMGMEGKSAQEVQDEINKVIGSNSVKSDNRWGDLSRRGLAALYNRWKTELSPSSSTATSIPQISYTPGIMNNALFSSTGNTTTDFNIAKLSLIPKLKETKPFVPGTYRVSSIYDRNYIRGNRDDYSNVDEYWDYLNNNRDSTNFKLFLNIMRTNDGNLNKEAFYRIMNQYGISGNLGRRDSGRLAKLLNDLNLIGTEGTDMRNSFIDSYNKAYDANYNDLYIKDAAQKLGWMVLRKQGGQLVSKNPIKRFKSNFR